MLESGKCQREITMQKWEIWTRGRGETVELDKVILKLWIRRRVLSKWIKEVSAWVRQCFPGREDRTCENIEAGESSQSPVCL